MDFYGRKLNACKANLHTHSTVSDGDYSPAELIRFYRENGYRALAFSDHHKTNPVSTYDGGGLTLLSGIELHPKAPRDKVLHLLALGVPEDFPGDWESAQAAVDAVNAAGGLVFFAHPYWGGFTSAEVMSLSGLAGIEVCNTACHHVGKGISFQLWDEILDTGLHCSALAVDDIHLVCELFRSWTVICAEDNSPQSLLKALKAGDFYASQGPEFRRLSCHDGIFEAEFSPCCEVFLVSARFCGAWGWPPDPGCAPGGCRAKPDCIARGWPPGYPGEELTTLRVDLRKHPPVRYLRCQIRDRNGRCAWSMPLYFNS